MMSSLCRVNKQCRAFTTLEYVILITILAAGLYTFRGYIQRGFHGQYRKAGDSFGFLRQYNPGASRDCIVDTVTYDKGCFNNKVLILNCARKAAGKEYDGCIEGAKAACTTGCNF